MATQSSQVQDWRARIIRLLDALEDAYNIVDDYSSLGGVDWLEESVADGETTINGHGDLTPGQVVSMIVSISAVKTFVEGGFHDDNLIKARS